MVSPVADEREALTRYLAQERYVLTLTAHGLTDEQARLAPSPSPLSVAALIKHSAAVEEFWIGLVQGIVPDRDSGADEYQDNFRLGPDETLDTLLDRYAEVAARTDAVLEGINDLGQAVKKPAGVPWFPEDVDAWSVRWVLLHLISETARHAGHADIVRESIDGATAFPLMAAAEGWPATPWMQPWEPQPETAAS
jgi:hypothetical protein